MGKSIDALALRAELESEFEWREAELIFVENQMVDLREDQQDRFRRVLVLLMYAHLEGYCKAALATYGEHLNRTGCIVADVEWAIAAASLSLVFKRLRDSDKKSALFRRSLPDESKLHRFCRERDFLEQASEFQKLDVDIPVDEVVDTESNLKPVVLKKILYRLGLDETLADEWSGELNRLLMWRNGIAHGTTKRPIGERDYAELKDAWSEICRRVTVAVFDAAHKDAHLRSTPAPATVTTP